MKCYSNRPVGRHGLSLCCSKGNLVIFGGIKDITREKNDLFIFDFQTG